MDGQTFGVAFTTEKSEKNFEWQNSTITSVRNNLGFKVFSACKTECNLYTINFSNFVKINKKNEIVWNLNIIVFDKWQWYIEFMKQIPKRIINDLTEGWMRPVEIYGDLLYNTFFPDTNRFIQ